MIFGEFTCSWEAALCHTWGVPWASPLPASRRGTAKPRSSRPRSRRPLPARGATRGCSAWPARGGGSRGGRPGAGGPGLGLGGPGRGVPRSAARGPGSPPSTSFHQKAGPGPGSCDDGLGGTVSSPAAPWPPLATSSPAPVASGGPGGGVQGAGGPPAWTGKWEEGPPGADDRGQGEGRGQASLRGPPVRGRAGGPGALGPAGFQHCAARTAACRGGGWPGGAGRRWSGGRPWLQAGGTGGGR